MTPFDDFVYLINHVLLGEEPTIEDFILLVGTLVAFIAFILWCCFPIQPKHRQFTCKIIQSHIKAFDAATSTADNATAAPTPTAASSNANANANANANVNSKPSSSSSFTSGGSNFINSGSIWSRNTLYNGGIGSGSISSSGSYSKNGTVAMHNYYVKNGHHCCT